MLAKLGRDAKDGGSSCPFRETQNYLLLRTLRRHVSLDALYPFSDFLRAFLRAGWISSGLINVLVIRKQGMDIVI